MGTDDDVVPCNLVVGVADGLELLDSFTVATMPAATSAPTMSTTGTAMRIRLTRGHGRSARGARVGSAPGASVVSVSVNVVRSQHRYRRDPSPTGRAGRIRGRPRPPRATARRRRAGRWRSPRPGPWLRGGRPAPR